ncbi:MAG: hypothetical protein LBF09_07810 [Odoribacteraceae bacterium]|jgi:hypothetical protein|nr:hypothetical protein [Odoribacteraceae bacterium]
MTTTKPSSRNKTLAAIALAIILAAYNLLAFSIPFTRGPGYWSGYLFSTLAILLAAAASFRALGRAGVQNKFRGLPVLYIAWTYLGLQLVAGFTCMSLDAPPWLTLSSGVFLLGACLVGWIAVEIGITEIKRVDEATREKVSYIKSLQAEVDTMTGRVTDHALKKSLQQLSDDIRYSDPVSNPLLSSLESHIEREIATLRRELDAGNTTAARGVRDNLQQLLAERNRKCRLLK